MRLVSLQGRLLGLRHLVAAFMPFSETSNHPNPAELKELCNYATRMFKTLRLRTHTCHGDHKPVLIFTDGAWESDVASAGAVLINGDERVCFVVAVPEELVQHWKDTSGEQIISQIELWALVAVRWFFREKLVNRRVIAWIDNEAARASAIKATSPSETMRALTRLLADLETVWPLYSWTERVWRWLGQAPLRPQAPRRL